MEITFEKTKFCVVGNCGCTATNWEGFLLKSRDKVKAGFCPTHTGMKIKPTIKGCIGIYDKSLGLT